MVIFVTTSPKQLLKTYASSFFAIVFSTLILIETGAGWHDTLHRIIETGLDLLFIQNKLFKYKINLQRIT